MISNLHFILALTGLLFHSVSFAPATLSEDDTVLHDKAKRIARETIIVDTHIDLPIRLHKKWEDVSQRTPGGEFDYPRAMEGGLTVAFMSIYVAADFQDKGKAKGEADSLINIVERMVKEHPDKFIIARSVKDVQAQFGSKKVSLPMGMENGAPLEGKLENLKYFYERGIRYITLTHSRNNDICDSSYDKVKKWKGLSPFGEKVVAEMNHLGIMVDISHVSDSTFYDALKISKAPLVATHSGCRHFTPGFERNMSDDMIKKLAAKGGVIQIPFSSMFIDGTYTEAYMELRRKVDAYKKENNLKDGDEQLRKYRKTLDTESESKMKPVDIKQVADHIDHVVKIAGVDHVGFGSDYDGSFAFATGLRDVSKYPNLIYELLKRGYSENDIKKICSGNILRLWQETENVAKKLSSAH